MQIPPVSVGGTIQPEEYHRARCFIIRQLQREHFAEEFKQLSEGHAVKRKSRLAKFRPYFDEKDGIIRLTGRTGLSNSLEETHHFYPD